MGKTGKRLLAVMIGCGIFAASFGVTNAYLAKNLDALNNLITPGKLEIELSEPDWKEENGRNLVPRETVSKNPTVTNTGETSVWVFLKVSVPKREICLVDAQTKRRQEKTDCELFQYEVQEDWVLLERTEKSGSAEYVYGFSRPLAPAESSSELFSEVSMVNYLEGELDPEDCFELNLEAAAIQEEAVDASVGLAAIYQTYLKQEEADKEGAEIE